MSHESARAAAIADLMRAGREMSRLSMVFRYAIAERLGLTVSDLECLDYLADAGSATAGQVADRTNLTTGAVTSMLRRLQQAGYVSAEHDPADRRRVIVTLRPKRMADLERPYEQFAERTRRLVADYSVEEIGCWSGTTTACRRCTSPSWTASTIVVGLVDLTRCDLVASARLGKSYL
ncbi:MULTISPECIES: MarR family transcriptional regulator [unclassified Solwaraspora]|uniref:MarR family transcriptional regulator n=1 Tax=unclassified Solwaraspora TaxID=2627926 RepID=UPI00259B25F1|nr:MarR family transcriptional regulator [Solwaraspora sp. WMMA2056]WJK41366.1 MarR family transcriptional regulator [Solwaraspora sp. WMMA2056]